VMEYLRGEGASPFNPKAWDGIVMDPVDFEVDEDMPKEIKPYKSKVPHGLEDAYRREWTRLTKNLCIPSNSSIASPVVVAKKKTEPFVRLCGDYRRVNKDLKFQNTSCLMLFMNCTSFSIRSDQRLSPDTHNEEGARLLSLQTPFGQYEPKFMPEGVSPASMFLMAVMHEIFEDFLDWMIVIHDNILVLCSTHEDAYDKLVKVSERCKERNRYLKIAKSNFGINKVNFFGYECAGGSYSLSEERKQSVTAIPLPCNTKSIFFN
jgi:hypothetical protein